MEQLVRFRVLVNHEARKVTFSNGVPSTVAELVAAIKEQLSITTPITLHYKDKEFDDFFTLTSTEELKDKDTLKVVDEPMTVVLSVFPQQSTPDAADVMSSCEQESHSSSSDTVILSPPPSERQSPWPAVFPIPVFSHNTELALRQGNEIYLREGTPLTSPRVKSDILERLAETILELITASKRKDNVKTINDMMAQTYSLRRQEVVAQSPMVPELKERWPALFDPFQINEEFRRCTAVPLEPKFMFELDRHSPKLMQIFSDKGGAVGQRIKNLMMELIQDSGVSSSKKRDVTLKCLTEYMGESVQDLITDFHLAQKCGERQLSEARGEAGAGKVCVEEPAEAENTRWMWMKQNLRGCLFYIPPNCQQLMRVR
ncbi:hypothetical protein FQA47_019710 [Oryzias melastigma]|uniref:PB1 domain-containing protein n=1 Tax=Oryzias melastigma TaxID=30732 RepID=A0A834FFS5_ORYME|nr:hypothetical protein FQA47_019710 [Oryzias melastigma]